jgi:uncharacterized protein CbrC (UPF0167 family)
MSGFVTLWSGLFEMEDSDPLPFFRYHPDPVATGAVKLAPDMPCLGCNRTRGYIYTGPVFTEKNFILAEHLCPWCIADGTAAKRFGATFNDTGMTENVPDPVRDEIEARTPGFNGWQQEQWLSCCGDAAAFLGTAGAAELERNFPAAIPVVRKYLRREYHLSKEDAEEFFNSLSKHGQPTAYIFGCLHCNKYCAYVDQA